MVISCKNSLELPEIFSITFLGFPGDDRVQTLLKTRVELPQGQIGNLRTVTTWS